MPEQPDVIEVLAGTIHLQGEAVGRAAQALENIRADQSEIKRHVEDVKRGVEDLKRGVEEIKKDVEKVKKDVDDVKKDVDDVKKKLTSDEKTQKVTTEKDSGSFMKSLTESKLFMLFLVLIAITMMSLAGVKIGEALGLIKGAAAATAPAPDKDK